MCTKLDMGGGSKMPEFAVDVFYGRPPCSQCFEFRSVLCHCCLSDINGIRTVKTALLIPKGSLLQAHPDLQ